MRRFVFDDFDFLPFEPMIRTGGRNPAPARRAKRKTLRSHRNGR